MFKNILYYHRFMLIDHIRLMAYEKAIKEALKDGDIVADIGTGSGILAFLALKAGAKRVYAIEQNEIIEEARELSRINGFEDKIIFIKGRSDKIELPEKVDLIISEIIGHFGIDENMIKFISDFKRRFLKKGGKMVPSWIDLYIVPVEAKNIWADYIDLWNKDFYGIDFSIIREEALSQQYVMECSGQVNKIAEPVMICHLDLYDTDELPVLFKCEFEVNKKGTFHGYTGYFMSELSSDNIVSTSPEEPQTNWKQTFLPVKNALSLDCRDRIILELKAISIEGSLFWEWNTEIYGKESQIATFSQKNINITKEDLFMEMDKYKPVINYNGTLAKRMFELSDGTRTVKEISEILLREYPEKYKYYELALQDMLHMTDNFIKLGLGSINK